ncbi:hypothetical protein [Deinococcus knuensis]|uniref:Adhesin domain-containing protein n=1 Tax=Deinococcus knuensis TaxID=1837380 RepID=A0ABQ2SXZ4_9DEIO|nr:hypothetical protein [Deinococcus knuensis]GGS43931.1 hypothetical protein GCM10008961_38610 [Deinococcus knuensis]
MDEQHGSEDFRSQVQRLVAEGKLTPEEAAGLLEDHAPTPPDLRKSAPTPPGPTLPGHFGPSPGPDAARDLTLNVSGYSLSVVTDPTLSAPTLNASEEGQLTLRHAADGWHVVRQHPIEKGFSFTALRAILTVPFTPNFVHASVEGGNLTLPDLSGDLNAEVSGGNLKLQDAHALHATVNGGNLNGGSMSGPAYATVNGGNLTLAGSVALTAGVNGGNLRWAGVLGSGDHRVEVNAGNATLHLGAGSSVTLNAELTMGSFRADFPTQRSGSFLTTYHTGQIGGGEAHLHCRVTAGGLKVVTA